MSQPACSIDWLMNDLLDEKWCAVTAGWVWRRWRKQDVNEVWETFWFRITWYSLACFLWLSASLSPCYFSICHCVFTWPQSAAEWVNHSGLLLQGALWHTECTLPSKHHAIYDIQANTTVVGVDCKKEIMRTDGGEGRRGWTWPATRGTEPLFQKHWH